MEPRETADQLTIVNRSVTYKISKKLIISKVPHFNISLSHDSLESKENMVKLDFDEQAFELFLTWVQCDLMLIEMKNLINLCTIMDYFGIEYWVDKCAAYFQKRFSISDLPVVIPQVTPVSKCINSAVLNAFICRHFSKIASSTFWLHYPIETIEYICNLDLMIHSEMQVFNAIVKWVNFDTDSRKDYLERLFKLVRWCNLDDNDLSKIKENDFFTTSNFEPIFCSPDKCIGVFDRTNQYYFVLVEELHEKDLRIRVLDQNFQPLIIQVFKLDESMRLDLLRHEYISDIYNIGWEGQMMLIDWNQNRYRLLSKYGVNDYVNQIMKFIINGVPGKSKEYKIVRTRDNNMILFTLYDGLSNLELDEQIVYIEEKNEYLSARDAPTHIYGSTCKTDYLSTALGNKIYIMNQSKLIQYNIDNDERKEFPGRYGWEKYKSFLTSMPSHDKVILFDSTTRICDCFDVKNEKWITIGLLANKINYTDDAKKSNDQMRTFTSTFLQRDITMHFNNLKSNA